MVACKYNNVTYNVSSGHIVKLTYTDPLMHYSILTKLITNRSIGIAIAAFTM